MSLYALSTRKHLFRFSKNSEENDSEFQNNFKIKYNYQ